MKGNGKTKARRPIEREYLATLNDAVPLDTWHAICKRAADDALGMMPGGEVSCHEGTGAQINSVNRWGNYSSMSVDPVDDCTFWYTQEYYATTTSWDFKTRICSFKHPNCQQRFFNDGFEPCDCVVDRFNTDDEGWAVVEVIDNGTGIAPDRMSRVFEPFFTTKDISQGTGLGLAICRNIIRDAGGTIEANSQPGRGTSLVVRLPASERVSVPHVTQAPPTVTPGTRASVIVVDDEPLVGRSIRRALRGHDVQVFTSGEEAIERLCSDEPFDVVFCDLMMPEVSGMDVYTEVAARRPEHVSRFVFMTGGAFTAKARKFLEETSVSCLEKPFELRQIRDLVAERAALDPVG